MEEMNVIMKSIGQSSSNIVLEELMNKFDDDFRLVFHLIAENMEKKFILQEINKEDELSEVFKVFDRDQNGFISAKELKTVMISLGEKLTDEEAEQMIKEADLDGDGKVNYHDFLTTMMSM
ncbi:hypothetical protein KSP39_PZI009012 [Platanthera zijinensis]|uniref:EF-hand domain-containing protein n=1 Tax=Platanthera zijinensis TaxID=2320716 RepID=A0AAP0BK69_9ASPA